MAWYRTGTVTLTNTTSVVGVGTSWSSNAVAGDMLTIDGQHFYEIAAVPDDTHITLQTAYAGTPGTGQPYAIIRTNDASAALAMSLASMVSKWHLTLDEFLNWQTSQTDVTLTNPATGASVTVKTPYQLSEAVASTIAQAYATAAGNSASNAAVAATNAAVVMAIALG